MLNNLWKPVNNNNIIIVKKTRHTILFSCQEVKKVTHVWALKAKGGFQNWDVIVMPFV